MRKPLFKDVRVRKAICLLQNRRILLDKLAFKQYLPLRSYWPSANINPKENPVIRYNPREALKLFAEAGYDRVDKDGFLINKKGQHVEFTISYTGESFERYLTVFKEDCAKSGVRVNLQLLSWATLLKKADQFSFDTMVVAWSGELFPDGEELWYSKHANEPGGLNYAGYQNHEVDRMIDSMKGNFNAKEREKVIKKIDALIYNDYPYMLQWGANFSRVYYWNKFGMPKTVLSRLNDWSGALSYWWYDPVRAERLKNAMHQNKSLPKETVNVFYDDNVKNAVLSAEKN
jgi:microcin C transport system substrate-binding protein